MRLLSHSNRNIKCYNDVVVVVVVVFAALRIL